MSLKNGKKNKESYESFNFLKLELGDREMAIK